MNFLLYPPFPRRSHRSFWALFAPCVLIATLGSGCNEGSSSSAGGGGSGATGGSGASGGAGGQGGTGGGETAAPVADTAQGQVVGALVGDTRVFMGIPFAEPPVGDLRWKPPVPHAPWADPLDATKKGRACTQNNPLNGKFDATTGEDCLYLNVWAPQKPASEKVPVLVWIHGGAFTLGSGGDAAYNGQAFSEATGAIVVTINYRLGPLGFLALPELSGEDAAHPTSGNYGMLDQRLALSWVKENIAAFGGDPANVTIFGESAGGISSCLHMVMPASSGLFHRAILQSGPCDRVDSMDQATTQGALFVDKLACTGQSDVLACLRGKPVEDLMSALPTGSNFLDAEVSWFPIVDGVELPDAPDALITAGTFEKVPVIMGTNADEATLFFALAGTQIADEAQFEMLAEQLVPGKGAEIVALYPTAEYGSAQAAGAAAIGDAGFICPTRRTARALAKGSAPTYLYHFTFDPGTSLLGDLGAFHSAEIKYVLGNPGQLLPGQLTDEEIVLSKAMMGYWSRLAAKGDPNDASAVMWPEYDQAGDQNIVFGTTITTQTGLRKDQCDFWDGVLIAGP